MQNPRKTLVNHHFYIAQTLKKASKINTLEDL